MLVPDERGVAVLGTLPGVRPVRYPERGPLPDAARSADVLVVAFGSETWLAPLCADLPRLRLVQTLYAGADGWARLLPDGVLVSNARGAHGPPTAELAVALLLAVYRDLPGFRDDQAAGRWRRRTTDTLSGKRVLVLGAGDLGGSLRRLLVAFDTTVTLVGRRPRPEVRTLTDLPELLPDHDATVVMLPYTPDTHRLVDQRFLALMPDDGVLVNVARGGIVDTDALLAELTTGRLRAALDVTEPEPLPAGHPLWTAPGVLITPHVGGYVHDFRERGWQVVAAQIAQFAATGRTDNLVTR
ncbi:2-hydroxyacid dehydrogenase [Solwaraspora sp. WMMD791]|uniref:2-hydroxyacid dehydrogenase n=1 Tax=Solwaraspora sp. WMMD791 TaxID=3016086 RepID=UPI00249CEFB7|nr:2-hydroxyacid dehydrogenase [Solwaraspora sp. WMMD791]WFE29890.1 2-hydroxyacid dehydrogenase [Solwaraspora sp. WMMD791]